MPGSFPEALDHAFQSPVSTLEARRQGLYHDLDHILILLLGALLVQPRLGQRRLFIDDRHVLTPVEVEALSDGTLPVVLDRPLGQTETSFAYRLLQLVMERSGEPYAIGFSSEVFPQDEVMNALASGLQKEDHNSTGITVGAYGAGVQLNRRLRPIRIPISGGLLGLRAGWTNASQQPLLAEVRDLEDLRQLLLIQGLGWSDVEILDAAGLRTYTTAPQYLFRLVENQRVQLFPRGIAELEGESQEAHRAGREIVFDPHLLISYPFAGFFYVSPANSRLAKAIEIGFERAIAEYLFRLVENHPLATTSSQASGSCGDPPPQSEAALALVDRSTALIVPWRALIRADHPWQPALCIATFA